MRVLIVEDDRHIAENLYDFLEARGHQCDFTTSLAGARALLDDNAFDAIALDRNLPDGDGATLVRDLRASGVQIPILMLTARDALDDKLDGFAAGTDDYLAKPFALKEVEARLLALQRRAGTLPHAGIVAAGGLSYVPAAHEIRRDGVALALPPKGIRLLASMLRHPDRLSELEIAVWGHEQESSDNLRSVLLTVRKALDGDSPVEIRNVHGLGYKLVVL